MEIESPVEGFPTDANQWDCRTTSCRPMEFPVEDMYEDQRYSGIARRMWVQPCGALSHGRVMCCPYCTLTCDEREATKEATHIERQRNT